MSNPYVTAYTADGHALLDAHAGTGRTACGQLAGEPVATRPGPAERCPECWRDWRVRGDDVRERLTIR